MKGEWVKDTGKYVVSTSYKIGTVSVGNVSYDSCISKDDPNRFKVTCLLPGIRAYLGHYEEEDKGKERLEKAVEYWFTMLKRKG